MADTLSRAVESAIREVCARAILPRFRHLAAGDIIEKAADDLVTIADRESEAMLSERLAALLPEAAIVGEEAVHADPAVLNRLNDALCWIIDPLDGTHNFAHGREPFGVLLALAERGETIAGWIYDPLKDRMCRTTAGGGAFIDDERITARTSGETPPIAGISTLFLQPGERDAVMEHIAPHYRMVDIPRCAAEQYPRVALGQNDVALFNRTLAWDHAAGALWLNEAGGMVARLDGSVYRPGDWDAPGLVAAGSRKLWNDFVDKILKMQGSSGG